MGISPTQLLIILVIVALIFGTKKLRNIGGDLGSAVKNFKAGMADDTDEKKQNDADDDMQGDIVGELIEAKVEAKADTRTPPQSEIKPTQQSSVQSKENLAKESHTKENQSS